MRILITGGFGFVGGRLAVHLAEAGHQVVLGTRQVVDAPYWLPQAETVQTEWHDDAALESICRGVDLIIHAAGMNAQDCASDPVGALVFNGVATARLVAAACQASVRRFIYLSTAHVYVNPLVGEITEESCPRNLHPYATSHLAGEQAVLAANEREDILGFVLRLSNGFGAPVHQSVNCWMLLVNDLCLQAAKFRKLVLHSSGQQQRNFIALNEVSHVIQRLISCSLDTGVGGKFNVGSPVSQTVLSMAKLIQTRCLLVLGYEPELHRKHKTLEKNSPKLEYNSHRLASLGIVIDENNSVPEIDKLLLYCSATFISVGD